MRGKYLYRGSIINIIEVKTTSLSGTWVMANVSGYPSAHLAFLHTEHLKPYFGKYYEDLTANIDR
jgi:hypothetical protein